MEALTASTAAPLSPSPVALRLLSDERLARWAANGSQAAFAVILDLPRFGGHGVIRRSGSLVSW